MNYTTLDTAYTIQHIYPKTYGGSIKYDPKCIYCSHQYSFALMTTDGGAFRKCEKCRKNFKANIVNGAINNFNFATNHLKGTN